MLTLPPLPWSNDDSCHAGDRRGGEGRGREVKGGADNMLALPPLSWSEDDSCHEGGEEGMEEGEEGRAMAWEAGWQCRPGLAKYSQPLTRLSFCCTLTTLVRYFNWDGEGMSAK